MFWIKDFDEIQMNFVLWECEIIVLEVPNPIRHTNNPPTPNKTKFPLTRQPPPITPDRQSQELPEAILQKAVPRGTHLSRGSFPLFPGPPASRWRPLLTGRNVFRSAPTPDTDGCAHSSGVNLTLSSCLCFCMSLLAPVSLCVNFVFSGIYGAVMRRGIVLLWGS